MKVVIIKLKERMNPTEEPQKALKKNSYPEGKPHCSKIELAL